MDFGVDRHTAVCVTPGSTWSHDRGERHWPAPPPGGGAGYDERATRLREAAPYGSLAGEALVPVRWVAASPDCRKRISGTSADDDLSSGLAAARVRAGEPIVLFMHNSLDQLVTWFALARLGAVHVPINTALIGASLTHVLKVTGARIAIVDADLLPALLSVLNGVPDLEHVVVRGRHDPRELAGAAGVTVTDFAALTASTSTVEPVEVDELSAATILFTSGTTGVSKGCVLWHRYLIRQAQLHVDNLRLNSDDVLYAPFPLFISTRPR